MNEYLVERWTKQKATGVMLPWEVVSLVEDMVCALDESDAENERLKRVIRDGVLECGYWSEESMRIADEMDHK